MIELAITYLTPERFASSPQLGLRIAQDWPSLQTWLSTPSFAGDKRAAGAWCPCELEAGAVKRGRGPVHLLVADVDDCAAGAIDRASEVLSPYLGTVVPTFSATSDHPKHRIVLVPSRPLTPEEFAVAWPKMAASLADAGIEVDRGCKNVNRLYFACVSPSPERWRELGGARALGGVPVDVVGMLDAAHRDLEDEARARARRHRPRPIAAGNRDRYLGAALDRAASNVGAAGEGGRHDALLRESYALARLDLSEDQIKDALLPAFVDAAGEQRRGEGERAIRDAVRARRGVA